MTTTPASPVEDKPLEGEPQPRRAPEVKAVDGAPAPAPPLPEKDASTYRQAEAGSKHFYFNGNVFKDTAFGHDRAERATTTWAHELKQVDRRKKEAVTHEPDKIFDAACEAWARFRIVVLRYHPGERRRAEALMLRIAFWAADNDAGCKLFSTDNELALSLKDLSSPDHWPAQCHRSVIYLPRRKEPHTARFFSTSNGVGVEALVARLEEQDARLLVSLAGEWDAVEGTDPFDNSVCTLEVAGDKPLEPTPRPEAESAFDVTPRIVAGLFAGLKVDEYQELVSLFLPKETTQAATPSADARKGAAPTPPPPPTRHERWLAGDIDRVLGELGIRYDTPAAAIGAGSSDSRSPGYFLADDTSPYADPGWIVMNHPALLASRMDALLARYLRPDTSDRYHEAFLTGLARLDAAGVHPVGASWLLQGWQAALDAQPHNVDAAARQLGRLVEYVQAGRDDSNPSLAQAVIGDMADAAADLELHFQHEVSIQPLLQKPSDLVDGWSALLDHPQTAAGTKRFSERQAATVWALLRLVRSEPAATARAAARMLAKAADHDSPWRQAGGDDSNPLEAVPRGAALNLEHLLALMLDLSPGVWAAFAGGVTEAYAGAAQDAMAKLSAWESASAQARQAAIDGQRLALTCLWGLAPRIYDGADEHKARQVVKALCLANDDAANDGAVLGRLLAMSCLPVSEEPVLGVIGSGPASLADVVRFLRGLALVLREDDSVSPEQASNALDRVASALRAVWPAPMRRALAAQARDSLESLSMARDHVEAAGDRDALAGARKRIRATQAVLRSLGAVK